MFVPLHLKSDYSLGYGTASIDELVDRAAALGNRSVALTDLENLYGQVRFHHRCRQHGLHPLTGVELRPGFDSRRQVGRRDGRVILLAGDQRGYGNLCRIVSRRRGGERGSGPADDLPQLVTDHCAGLFALSDDPAMAEQLLAAGLPRERLGMLLVRPDAPDADRARQHAASRLNIRLVADLDAVFLQPADHDLHALQLAIRLGRPMDSVVAGADLESRLRWLRSPAEAAALFADLPRAIKATVDIAEACRLDLLEQGDRFAAEDRSGQQGAAEELRRLCQAVLLEKTVRQWWTRAHRRRLEEELTVFTRLGFTGLMLVVARILEHCRREGIPVAARGSAVSSLTLRLLGGSPVDPLAHGLLFERFLHPGKSSWPDVDLDLPWHRRDEVIDWVYRHFGRERVAMVAAHHTFGPRSALREGLKAWGGRPELIASLVRALPPEELAVESIDFLGLADPLDEGGILANLPAEMPGLGVILPLIQRLVGRPRHVAAHPGGLVIARHSLEELLPLERAPKGVVITQYDLVAIDRLGLAKVDLLGNRTLSELEEVFAEPGRPLRLAAIPAADPQTLALIDRADTLGCFQLESPAMRSLLARLPIRSQNDLVAALALIRPGAAAGAAKDAFVRRARGEEAADIPFPQMADRLRETHGLLLYEEDIMLLLGRIGGISLAEADELRAAIVAHGGDPQALISLRAGFLRQVGLRSGGREDQARRAWALAVRFAAYSFNKAHAASYGRLAYLSAYSKTHQPREFACALLNHHQGLYPLRTLAGEFVRMGIALHAPHVNVAEYRSVCEPGRNDSAGAVRVGLGKVRGLSRRAIGELLSARAAAGPFSSLGDLLARVRLNRRELQALVLAGAGDELPPLAADDYPFAHEAALKLLHQGGAPAGLDQLSYPRPAARDRQTRLYQALVRVRNELRYLGMHLSAHPMALLRTEADRHNCRTLGKAKEERAGTRVRVAAMVAAMRRLPTRQGAMQFLTLEDETGLLEVAVLPPVYRRLGDQVTTPGPFLVEGTIRRRQGAVHLEVIRLSPFHQRSRPF